MSANVALLLHLTRQTVQVARHALPKLPLIRQMKQANLLDHFQSQIGLPHPLKCFHLQF